MNIKPWQDRESAQRSTGGGIVAMQEEIAELRAALAERDAEIEHYIDQYEMLLRYNEAKLSERATLRAAAQQGLYAFRLCIWECDDRDKVGGAIAALTAALEMKHE